MSVIVMGMNMPKDCYDCDFLNPFVGEPYCRRLMKRCTITGRLKDCPLGDVPTPHGKLIDLDKAHLYALDELFDVSPSYITNTEAAKAMMNIYEHIPTVIEAEE